MSTVGRTTAGRTKLVALLMVGAALFALLAAGCSGGSGTKTASAADQKAMLETVGKFYAAQATYDYPAMSGIIYDPQNRSGLATMTAPADAPKIKVVWKVDGDKLIIVAPSQESSGSEPSQASTLTAGIATGVSNAVSVTYPGGQSFTLIMTKDGGVWKIDYDATEKAAQAAAAQSGAAGQQGGGTATTP